VGLGGGFGVWKGGGRGILGGANGPREQSCGQENPMGCLDRRGKRRLDVSLLIEKTRRRDDCNEGDLGKGKLHTESSEKIGGTSRETSTGR